MPDRKRAFSEVEEGSEDLARQTQRRVKESPYNSPPATSSANSEEHLLNCPSRGDPASPVAMQYPTRLLSFSYNGARQLLFDNSAMKYFVNPPYQPDLRYGYDRWIKRPEEKGRLDGLLKAVSRYREGLDASTTVSPIDDRPGETWLRQMGFITWRGVMTKILTAPYEERDGWEINVMRLNDTIYLEEHVSNAQLVQKEDLPPRHRLHSYYGYAFESYCTTSDPHKPLEPTSEPLGWGGIVNTNVQWCSMVKTKLASHRLLIAGEVDCVKADHNAGSSSNKKELEFVELKTSLAIRNSGDEAKFEKKMLKFYFQSFLLGVPEIVVGFRVPAGYVLRTQNFKTIELPRLVRGKPHAWDPFLCMNWADSFLDHLKKHVPNQEAKHKKRDVWRVKFTPGTGVVLKQLDEAGVAEVENGEERFGFLPNWYFDELRLMSASSTTWTIR